MKKCNDLKPLQSTKKMNFVNQRIIQHYHLNQYKKLPIMKRFFLFLTFCVMLGFSNSASATHYIGSELYYFDLGNNQYQIHYVFYTDCNGIAPGLTAPIEVSSSCATTNILTLNKNVALSGDVQTTCSSVQSSCNGGSATGILRTHYSATVTLNPCSDWIMSFTSCCRNGMLSNLSNPSSQGFYVEATLDNSTGITNNSPNINSTEPIFFGCVNDTLQDVIEAFEADGDSLVFSLTPCLNSASGTPVNYAIGLSGTSPLNNGFVNIDPSTGVLTAYTTVAQSAAICIKIEEYRNGTKISEVMRDYHLTVTNCTNEAPSLYTINGGNPTTNSQHIVAIGQILTIDFYVQDSEVLAGTQTLTDSLFTNLNASIVNNGNGNFTLTYQPTATLEIGHHDLVILVKDDNCPMIGQNSFTIGIDVVSLPFIDAIDDIYSGFSNQQISGNFLLNDLSSDPLIANTTPDVTPLNGSVTILTNGGFTYIPSNNFVGIDSFRYVVCNQNLLCDTATVYLNIQPLPTIDAVNDAVTMYAEETITLNLFANDTTNGSMTLGSYFINPTDGTGSIDANGNLTFTAGQATVMQYQTTINYQICNGSVCDNAIVFITVLVTNTFTDTIILGESYPSYDCFSSVVTFVTDTLDNAVMTFPNGGSCFDLYGDYLGTDTTALTSISEKKIYQITVVNGVWPGDTDDDALVNNVDLLNIGLAYNAVGVPRSQQSIQWNGYLANDWGTTFAGTNLDYKHADANGDGMVDANDTMAIVQNWGLTYNKNGGRNGASVYLETDSMTIINDSIAYIPIMLGTMQQPVSNIYGMAFTINYSSGLVRDSSVMVHFDPSWLGVNNQNMISIGKDFYNNELMEVAVTRIDGNNISGSGQVGRMCFTIQDDIIRGVDSLFTFDITNITAIDNNNTTVDLQGEESEVHWERIIEIANNTQKVDLSTYVNIYPNPTTDYLTISAKAVTIESVEIYDLTGRRVLSEFSWNNSNQLDISELNEGFYIVHIKTNLGIWNEKIMVVKP